MNSNKENPQPRSGYAAALALRRKQAAEQAAAPPNNVPLPRVAAVGVRASQSRSPAKSGNRPLSSLGVQQEKPAPRPAASSVHRVGCKPATHSTRFLVPLLDAHACSAAPAPAASKASAPLVPSAPAPSYASSNVDLELESEEQQLQAELALYDQRLEQLQQHSQRRAATPTPDLAAAALGAAVACASPPAPQPAAQSGAQAAAAQQQSSAAHQQHAQEEAVQKEHAVIPATEQSIVKAVTTATGNGCRDIIAAHGAATLPAGACWTTRGHRVLYVESSCILQLWGRQSVDVTLRITFADATAVPRLVRLEHAATPTAAFERLGEIMLQPKSLQQLRHLFRLGKGLEVQRYMRITLVGHMAKENSGTHRVSHMLLTSGLGPQRSRSQMSALSDAGTATSAQASVNHSRHSRPQEQATADSAASTGPAALSSDAEPAKEASPSPAGSHLLAPAPPLETVLTTGGTGVADAPTPQPEEPAGPDRQPAMLQAAAAMPLPQLTLQAEPAFELPGMAAATLPELTASQDGAAPAHAPAPAAQHVAAHNVAASAAKQQPTPSRPMVDVSWQELPNQQMEDTVWGQLEGVEAAVDFQPLEEFGAREQPMQQPEQPKREPDQSSVLSQDRVVINSSQAARLMLLPMQRCDNVSSFLSQLELSPQQVKDGVLKVFDPQRYSSAADLTDEQVAGLLVCLPSANEKRLLAGYREQSMKLSSAEQFMVEMMQLPGLGQGLEAWRFGAQLDSRAHIVEAAASLLSSACREVRQSDLLQTLLKVALLAGNFLNAGNRNGAAAGFQIDALLKLKDVRSTRARSRTLLHFVAREVARQHPCGACLQAALPSAAAAAQLDLVLAQTELEELTAGIRRLELALASAQADAAASDGICSGVCLAYLTRFRAAATERVRALQAQLEQAEAAFEHLGSFINGQRSTLASPAAFFGVLNSFATELDAAFEENSAADAAVAAAAARKEGKQRHRSSTGAADGSSPGSSLVSEQSQPRQRGHRQENSQPQRQQSPSNSAGSSKKVAGQKGSSSRAVDAAQDSHIAAGSGQAAAAVQPPQQGSRLSTPVASLLAESARLITSMDCGEGGFGGFGSTVGSEAAGSSSGASGNRDPAAGAAGHEAGRPAAEADGSYLTPRGEVALRWPGPQREAAGQRRQPGLAAGMPEPRQDPTAAVSNDSQQWQTRYSGTVSAEEEVPAFQAAGEQVPAEAGDLASRGSQQLIQPRQRSLQQLSPTSTPLSSLGRQSSRSSINSSVNGSTPGSAVHPGVSLLRRSSSPLGLPAAPGLGAAVANAGAAAARGHGAARPRAALPAGIFSPELTTTPAELPAEEGLSPLPDSSLPARAAAATLPAAQQPAATAVASHFRQQPQGVAAQQPAQAQRAPGFGDMHTAASSMDLTFYAPFGMNRGTQSSILEQQQGHGSLPASLADDQESAGAWGPLAAQQQLQLRASNVLRRTAVDDLALPGAQAAGAAVGGRKRVSFSLPSSPRGSADLAKTGPSSRPPALDLQTVAGRLQVQQQQPARGASGGDGSPVLQALLNNVPTPPVHNHADLNNNDIADLSDQEEEDEWEQLERIQQQQAERERQQAAEREQRELLLLHHPMSYQQAAQQQQQPEGQHQQQPQWASEAQLAEWLGQQELAVQQQHQAAEQQQELAALQQLPSPITSATTNMDAAVAKLLASAGNTPTGPLARGVREAETFADTTEAAALRASAGWAPGTTHHHHVALLEPIMPAPLGEGVRSSHSMAQHVPAAALRMSLQGPRAMLRNTLSAPAATLSLEAEAWAAEEAAGRGAHGVHGAAAEGQQQLGYNTGVSGSQYGTEFDGGCGPIRRPNRLRGLRHKFLGR